MSDMKIPNIKTYTCSDGFVTDNEQVAKSHEINIKNKKLLCPFCQQELKEIELGECWFLDCPKCHWTGEDRLWQELDRTRKALDESEHCCTEWEKQALDYKAKNIKLSTALDYATEMLTRIAVSPETMLEPEKIVPQLAAQAIEKINEIKGGK